MEQTLYLFPSHLHAADYERCKALSSPARVTFGQSARAISDFEMEVAETALAGDQILSAFEERLLWGHAAKNALQSVPLMQAHDDLAAWFGATMTACHHAGVDAQAIRHCLPEFSPTSRARIVAIADGLEILEGLAGSRRIFDRAKALRRAVSALREGARLPRSLDGLRTIIVRYVYDWSPARLALLDAVARRMGPRAEIIVELPYREATGKWFVAAARQLSRLEALQDQAQITVLPIDPCNKEGVGAAFARRLSMRTTGMSEAGVELLQASDPASECEAVSRHICDWLDDGMAPETIAVALRTLEPDAALLADSMRVRGIPVHRPSGVRLQEVAVIRFLLGIVETAVHPQKALSTTWASTLSSMYAVAFLRHAGVERSACLLRTLGEAATMGRNHSLQDLAEWFRASNPALSGALQKLALELVPLREGSSLPEFVQAIRRLINLFALRESVGDRIDFSSPEEDAESVGRDRIALERFEMALQQLDRAASLAIFEPVYSSVDCWHLLRTSISEYKLELPSSRVGAVRILPIRSLFGLDFGGVVIPGLREDEFPRLEADDPLLPAADRFRIARVLGRAEPHKMFCFETIFSEEQEHYGPSANEWLTFILGVTAATRRVTLSRSVHNRAGQYSAASVFFEDVAGVLGRAVDDNLSKVAYPCPDLGHAVGREDVLRSIASARLPPVIQSTVATTAWDRVIRDVFRRVSDEQRRQRGESNVHSGYLSSDLASLVRLSSMSRGSRDRPWSTTELEMMARCPYQYFSRRVLRLSDHGSGGEEMDARERGTFAHRCFEVVIRALVNHGLTPFVTELTEPARKLAESEASNVVQEYLSTLPGDAVLRRFQVRETAHSIVALVAALYRRGDGFSPLHAELAFGPKGALPALQISSGTTCAYVEGRIDLLEVRGEEVRVSDLKSSARQSLERKLSPNELGSTALQLPIYSSAARAIHPGGQADARFLSLKDKDATETIRERWERSRTQTSVSEIVNVQLEDGRATSLALRILELHEQVSAGAFQPNPVAEACRTCAYRAVCRFPTYGLSTDT